jgi:hypothetical protein
MIVQVTIYVDTSIRQDSSILNLQGCKPPTLIKYIIK